MFDTIRKENELKIKTGFAPERKLKRIKINMNPEDNKEVEVIVPVVEEKSELELVQEQLAKAIEERDNYKNVALTRKGKLSGDADFFKEGNESELSVAEQVRIALLERDVEKTLEAERQAQAKLIRENTELRLALKNRPGSSIGGDSGSSSETKDNVFSVAQIAELTAKAKRLGAEPEKFIQKAKENLMKRG